MVTESTAPSATLRCTRSISSSILLASCPTASCAASRRAERVGQVRAAPRTAARPDICAADLLSPGSQFSPITALYFGQQKLLNMRLTLATAMLTRASVPRTCGHKADSAWHAQHT